MKVAKSAVLLEYTDNTSPKLDDFWNEMQEFVHDQEGAHVQEERWRKQFTKAMFVVDTMVRKLTKEQAARAAAM